MLDDVNELLKTKSLSTRPSNVLPLHPNFPAIQIFTEDEGDGIESRLPFKIFENRNKFISLEIIGFLKKF